MMRSSRLRAGIATILLTTGAPSIALTTATAVALEDTRLLTLDRETFHTILQRHPDVRAAVLALHRSRNPFPLPATPAAGVVNA